VLGLAIGITLLVVAWGYLVYTAIDVGGSARDGDRRDWLLLALAAVGAIACLFAGLMLLARLIHRLTAPAPPAEVVPPPEQSSRHRA
jgi:hypothetical protein